MSDKKQLLLEDGSKLDWLEKSAEMFLNKSIVLYGLSNTGKGRIIIDILYSLRNYISFPFVICKSQVSAEKDYSPRIPRSCITHTLTKEWLEQFIKTQEGRARLYNIANSIKNLQNLFSKIKNGTAKVLEAQIMNNTESIIQEIELSNMSFAQKKSVKEKIRDGESNMLKLLYRAFIRRYYNELDKYGDKLTDDEYITLHHIDFIPHALLIFDDCAFLLKKWIKENPGIKELFYQGRHFYTTVILATQADKDIDSEIRKNARLSFFTSAQDAAGAFTRASNNYPDRDRKRTNTCIKAVFMPDGIESKTNFQKLVYDRDNPSNPFKYTIADLFDDNDFQLGADSVWDLDSKMRPNDDDYKASNFLKRYARY